MVYENKSENRVCELTILMPCLNEAETLRVCIRKAKQFLMDNQINGEVLISDNGSVDGSQEIAVSEGVRLVSVDTKGYGSALIHGCKEAYGKYVIMGDADDSYDFLNLMPFLDKLREGYELVMGNRFLGGIQKGAMPWLHRYIGNPILSFIGRLFYKSSIKDFHCGLRGYNRKSILGLGLHTTGMEYASEMVVMSEINGLRIAEVPTTLCKDGRSRPPHLRSFRDGWRHLKFLFMYAPNWLFLYPGLCFLALGVGISAILTLGELRLFEVTFSIHTLLYSVAMIIIGFNIIDMYLLIKLYAYNHKFYGKIKSTNWNKVKEDWFIFGGVIVMLVGLILGFMTLFEWKHGGFGELLPEVIMRKAIPAVAFMEMGVQSLFSGFIMGIFKIRKESIA